MKVRQPNFGHALGVQLAVPYEHAFTPTPMMTPREIAYSKGADAGRRGLRESECPYEKVAHANLYELWMRGYNDAIGKADTTRRLKDGSESGDGQLGSTGDEESASAEG